MRRGKTWSEAGHRTVVTVGQDGGAPGEEGRKGYLAILYALKCTAMEVVEVARIHARFAANLLFDKIARDKEHLRSCPRYSNTKSLACDGLSDARYCQ
jgi:hypothetical protein